MKTFLSIIFLLVYTIQDDFTFTNENQKVVLKIDNGSRNLTWGNKSILNLKVENIETQKMSMSAPGIRFIKSANPKEEITLEITPEKNVVGKDTLNLNVGFRDKENNITRHVFKILITQ